MSRVPRVIPTLLLATTIAQGPIPTAPLTAVPATPHPIDLAICLDISGSMNGLIDAARQNLWAVVNDLATLRPTPVLRVALLSYGCSAHDAERGWVKVETGFTSDLDLVSQKLFNLTTNGGEEYVARVVHTALAELDWSQEKGALQLLFVAGNEAATQDPQFDAGAESRAAIARGIVVNSIYCGDQNDNLAPAWREVAKLADGQFSAIDHNNAVVITTPFDARLGELSVQLNTTYVVYGREGSVWAENQVRQDSNASGLNPAAAAQRCQTKAGVLYANPNWDLVDACKNVEFKLEAVKKEDLPEALRALTLGQLKEHVAEQTKKRAALQAEVDGLGKQRDAFVLAEQRRLSAAGKTAFDTAVRAAVRQQAESRGFQPPAPPAPVPGSTPADSVPPPATPAPPAPPSTPATPATTSVPAPAPVAPSNPAPGASPAPAKPSPAPPPKQQARDVESPFVPVIKRAIADYQQFVRVTGSPRVAPTDCRIPPPPVRRSQAANAHGGKLYLLYARFADGVDYVKAGEPAQVGQTLVKEAWTAVDGEPTAETAASKRYMGSLVHRDGGKVHHAGESAGLFVMHKLAPETKDTDQGWIYGTIDAEGVVTAAGRVASCVRCHERDTNDRRYGLR